jgi:hypothetical protein
MGRTYDAPVDHRAIAAARRKPSPKRLAVAAGTWARIPAQVPLIRAALR